MTLQPLRLAGALLLAGLAAGAHAADIRPGLWEFRPTRMSPAGMPDMSAQIQQQLKNLSPETQQMLRQQLAARGLQLGGDAAVRSCITPEMARQDSVYAGRGDGNCVVASADRSGNLVRGRLDCSQPAGSADFETTLDGAEHMTIRIQMRSAKRGMQMDTDARWVADQCGATRPQL